MDKLMQILRKVNPGFIVIIALTFVLGWQLGHRDYQFQVKNYKPELNIVNKQPSSGNRDIDFKLFWDTWDLVGRKYIDKSAIDPQKLYFGAIQGMVAAIGDPYTVFLPPEAQKATKEQLGGAFEGVGIQLGYNKDKRLVVIAPLKDTPAEKAGIKAGDLILEINKKDALNLSLPEAVNLIRGPRGTTVTLALIHEDETKPRDVEITRDTITVKSVTAEKKETPSKKPIGYIRITNFGEKTKEEWDQAVTDVLAMAPQGVVVDVRNNPGGFLESSVYIASEFLDSGVVVMQENVVKEREEATVIKVGKLLKIPLVVLINKGSASASEILAGAIQDRERGKVVGETSFGKGTIQSAEDLPMDTGVHITTAKWLTPKGKWIHGVGLEPDVKVEIPSDAAEDLQLNKALELLDK